MKCRIVLAALLVILAAEGVRRFNRWADDFDPQGG